MKYYLVSYDLRSPGQHYDALIKHLESYPDHWHLQKSLWIVGPALSAYTVAEGARAYCDANDLMFVQNLTQECAWFGYDDAAVNWIQRKTE